MEPHGPARFELQKLFDSFRHHAACCFTSCRQQGQCFTDHQWLKHIVFAPGCNGRSRFPAMHVVCARQSHIHEPGLPNLPNVYPQWPEMTTLNPPLKIRLDVVADNRQPSSPANKRWNIRSSQCGDRSDNRDVCRI